MPTPIYVTSWGHGVNPITSGAGLADFLSGTPTVVTTPIRESTAYSLQISVSAATMAWGVNFTLQNRYVFTVYIRFNTLPTTDCKLAYVTVAAGNAWNLRFVAATNKLRVTWGASTGQQDAATALSANTWYRLDFDILVNAGTRSCKWQLDGSAQTQSDSTEAASTCSGLRLGTDASNTFTCFYNSLVLSVTAGDYPLGAEQVLSLSPNDDGTHSPATPDCLKDQGGTLISGSNKAFQYLDDVPFPTGNPNTNLVQQDASASPHDTHYAAVVFTDTAQTTIWGAIGLLAYTSSATQANNGDTVMLDNDNATTTLFGGDMSENTMFYRRAMVGTPSGGWNQTQINGLKMRIGTSGDASPIPRWQALMYEYAVAVSGGQTYTETGFGIKPHVASGVDVTQYTDAGRSTTPHVAQGVDAQQLTDAASAQSPHAADGAAYVEVVFTGQAASPHVALGADSAQYADRGDGATPHTAQGIDLAQHTDAGAASAPHAAQGPDAQVLTDIGVGYSPHSVAGLDAVEYVATGTASSPHAADGADVFVPAGGAQTYVETGTGISAHAALGVDLFTPLSGPAAEQPLAQRKITPTLRYRPQIIRLDAQAEAIDEEMIRLLLIL